MKKILLLIAAVCPGIVAIGQSVNLISGSQAIKEQIELSQFKGVLMVSEKNDSTIIETWNSPGWVFSSRERNTYQTAESTTTVTTQKRDASTLNVWTNSSKTVTTVNAGGKTTSQIISLWKTPGQWVPTTDMEFAYDGSGNMTMSSMYSSVSGSPTPVWFGIFKSKYTYSGVNLTRDIGYTWNISNWVNSDSTEYTYAGGLVTEEVTYDWDKTLPTPAYVKSTQTKFTYTSGKVTRDETFEWDETIPDWVKSSKTDYTYPEANKVKEETADWDNNLSVYVNKWKTEYEFDNGRIIKNSNYMWDGSNWDGTFKTETVYSSVPTGSKSVTISYTDDMASLGFVEVARTTSWYSGLNTSVINKSSEKGINVYPNPASEFIVFDVTGMSKAAKVELNDLNGNKVLEEILYENGQISVSHLKKGLYIYSLFNNGAYYKGKIVIE